MERNKGHIDEGTLHAWLDGALPPDESARVEAHIASCAACSAAAAEARGLVAAASRILTALDDVPGGVAPTRTLSDRRHRLWTGWPLRAAAGVLFVVAGSFAVLEQLNTDHGLGPTSTASPVQVAPPASPPVVEMKKAPVRKQRPVAPPAAPQPARAVAAAQAAKEAPVTSVEDSTPVAAKPVTIAGRVVEAKTGQPVPQAVVHLSSPQVSAVTDSTGGYAIAIPASQAASQPARLDVRRIGYDRATDSVTVAREKSSGDTVRRDFALQQATTTLSQVVVTGTARKEAPAPAQAPAAGVAGGVAKGAVRGLFGSRTSPRYPDGCYAIDNPDFPRQIELPSLRIPTADSARFRSKMMGTPVPGTVVIALSDTSGVNHFIIFQMRDTVLSAQVQRSDSNWTRPFYATRIGPTCP